MGSRVVTLTMNPALDDSFSVGRLSPATKMRCSAPRFDPGGGGINVARVLHVLREPVTAVFPVGGFLGQALSELLAAEGLDTVGIPVEGETRQSHHVRDLETGLEYRFVLPGAPLARVDQLRCLEAVRSHGRDVDYLVMSGSMPPGVAPGFVAEVARLADELGARLVLDVSGAALRAASGAYLIKPSARELEEFVGFPLHTYDDQVRAARRLLSRSGARVVILSRGNEGVVVVTPETAERVAPPPGPVVSTVGAGDALLAGVVAGLHRGWDIRDAAGFGVACSAAMIAKDGTSIFGASDVMSVGPEARGNSALSGPQTGGAVSET